MINQRHPFSFFPNIHLGRLLYIWSNNIWSNRSKYNWSNDIWSNNIWSKYSTKCYFLSIRFNILSNDICSNFKYLNKIFDQKLILQSQNQHLVEYLCLSEMNASEQVLQQTVEWKVVGEMREGLQAPKLASGRSSPR